MYNLGKTLKKKNITEQHYMLNYKLSILHYNAGVIYQVVFQNV